MCISQRSRLLGFFFGVYGGKYMRSLGCGKRHYGYPLERSTEVIIEKTIQEQECFVSRDEFNVSAAEPCGKASRPEDPRTCRFDWSRAAGVGKLD
jgi:hypothetical protein